MKMLSDVFSWLVQKFRDVNLKGKIAIYAGALFFICICLTSCIPSSNNNSASQSDMTAAFETAQAAIWEGITQTAAAFTPEPTATLEPTATTEPTPVPTATLVQTIALPPNVDSCVPQDTLREEGLVVGIIDGETINVQIDNQVYGVRYLGVDAPNVDEAYYWQTLGRNQDLVYPKQVVLVRDVPETDSNNQLLRYVFVGNIFVNYELIAQGYANTTNLPPDIACSSTFQTAEKQAKTSKIGLWSPPPTIVTYPTQAISSGSGGSGGSSSGGSGGNSYCCKVCRAGKACGDSCISRDKTCHQPPGCACDG